MRPKDITPTIVMNSPFLNPKKIKNKNETGTVLLVKRIGFLGPATIFTLENDLGFIQTTDDKIYQIPQDFKRQCYDIITLSLTGGGKESGMFPSKMEFGYINKKPYLEFLN